MKSDIRHKTEKLGEHIQGYRGYGVIHHLETDLLLRRHLALEVEKVRDRLAEMLAAGGFGDDFRPRLVSTLRQLAAFKAEVVPGAGRAEGMGTLSPEDEERLLDFDLVLQEKVAALHSQLDYPEWAADGEEAGRGVDLLEEGMREVTEHFRQRDRYWSTATVAGRPGKGEP